MSVAPAQYRLRYVDAVLDEALPALPAFLLTGPRGVGKTTTMARRATSIVRLDRPDEAAIFRDSPDVALDRLPRPVLLDEWQNVPAVIGAVERAVDDGAGPGSFLLTGSAMADHDGATWPGTGRLARLHLPPLSRAEADGQVSGPDLLARLLDDPEYLPPAPAVPPELPDYLRLAERGGFPAVENEPSAQVRALWFASYLDQIVGHDIPALGHRPDPIRLRRYLEVLAKNIAGMPADNVLYGAAGVTAATMRAYDDLLQAVGILDPAGAWTTNQIKRLALRRKVYLADTGLTMAALRVGADDALRSGDLYRRILDAFVAAQVRSALSGWVTPPRLHHVRAADGRHEVDQLIDLGHRGVIAIETKSTSSPGPSDAKHLAWLREQLGSRFAAGIVCHTGPRPFPMGERICALPIASFWQG